MIMLRIVNTAEKGSKDRSYTVIVVNYDWKADENPGSNLVVNAFADHMFDLDTFAGKLESFTSYGYNDGQNRKFIGTIGGGGWVENSQSENKFGSYLKELEEEERQRQEEEQRRREEEERRRQEEEERMGWIEESIGKKDEDGWRTLDEVREEKESSYVSLFQDSFSPFEDNTVIDDSHRTIGIIKREELFPPAGERFKGTTIRLVVDSPKKEEVKEEKKEEVKGWKSWIKKLKEFF